MNEGWILLHRSILNWEWYDDANTIRVFIHVLLKANHTPKKWRGIEVPRGSFLTSHQTLAKELGLSIQNIRTSISKLKSTGTLTGKNMNKCQMENTGFAL